MFKAKSLVLEGSNIYRVVLHEDDLELLAIAPGSTIGIKVKDSSKKPIYCMIQQTSSQVKRGQIGIHEEIFEKLDFKRNHIISLVLAKSLESVEHIHNRLNTRKKYTKGEFSLILKDINQDSYSQYELDQFFLSVTLIPLNLEEMGLLLEVLISMNTNYNFSKEKQKLIAYDCFTNVPGDISPIVSIPIAAAAGAHVCYLGPYHLETVSQFCDVDLSEDKLHSTLHDVGAVFTSGYSANLGSALDDLVVENYALDAKINPFIILNSFSKLISLGVRKLLLEMIYGPETSFKTKQSAKSFVKKITPLAKKYKLELEVIYTKASDISPSAFGTVQQAKEIFKILDNTRFQSYTQRARTSEIAGKLLEMSGSVRKGLGLSLSESIIDSEKALKKFEDLIRTQGPYEFEDQGVKSLKVKSDREGHLIHIDVKKLEQVLFALNTLMDPTAGIYMKTIIGRPIKKGEIICEFFSSSSLVLEFALSQLKQETPFIIQ